MAKEGLTADNIISSLQRKEYKPIYFLMGEEAYYIDKISDYIEENVLDESEKAFNQTIIYGKETDIDAVINAAKRFPMMSPYQVIIVKEAQHIKNFDNLIYYLQKPLLSTILVFCYKYGTLDKRSKLPQEIAKIGVLYTTPKLYDYQIPTWIIQYLKEKNVGIDPKAASLLAEYLGTDLSKIVNELDKLLITKPSGEKNITSDLIEKNIGISKDYNAFELQAALFKRDVVKANRIVFYLAQNDKETPYVVVLSVLFKGFSTLLQYHYIPNKSADNLKELGLTNTFFINEFEAASRIYNGNKCIEIISAIRTYDAKGKGIDCSTSKGELLKELVYIILH